MPTNVGTLQAITFSVLNQTDAELGNQVRLQVALYAQACQSIKMFLIGLPAVTVLIKKYTTGSGAVTIYKNRTVIVDRALKGGVQEMAESTLFELANWSQGDFSTREQDNVKSGQITPQQAGEAIARCEAFSVHRHGEFLQAIKAKGIPLSAYGEKQRTTAGKSLQQVEHDTMTSPHDGSAPPTDMMSLDTPEMYWYQTINGVANSEITARAIISPPAWLKTCIEEAWKFNDMPGPGTVEPAALYVKLLNLAKLAGCPLRGGYEFTTAMKIAAKETTVPPRQAQWSMQGIVSRQDMPGNLSQLMKAAMLLA